VPGEFLDRIRKIRWIGWSLPILAAALFFVDVYSGHIERSLSLAVFALVLGVLGLGLDLWVRSSPGEHMPVVDARKHPVVMRAVFFGGSIVSVIVLVQAIRDPQWGWRRTLLTLLIYVFSVASYNLLIAIVRYIRTRTHNFTSN
jgi:hypothetical protein